MNGLKGQFSQLPSFFCAFLFLYTNQKTARKRLIFRHQEIRTTKLLALTPKITYLCIMFLTVTILRNQGLRIDAGITDAVLNRCIADTQVLCEAMLGADATAILKGEQATSVLLVGGDTAEGKYLLGLQRSASYIAYALLLRDNVFASVYGTTNKRDDLSNQVDPVDAARQWYSQGERGLSALIEQLIAEDRLPKTYRLKPQNVPFINELA